MLGLSFTGLKHQEQSLLRFKCHRLFASSAARITMSEAKEGTAKRKSDSAEPGGGKQIVFV